MAYVAMFDSSSGFCSGFQAPFEPHECEAAYGKCVAACFTNTPTCALPRPGEFAEALRDQFMAEQSAYYVELEEALLEATGFEADCSREHLVAALAQLNPDLPEKQVICHCRHSSVASTSLQWCGALSSPGKRACCVRDDGCCGSAEYLAGVSRCFNTSWRLFASTIL